MPLLYQSFTCRRGAHFGCLRIRLYPVSTLNAVDDTALNDTSSLRVTKLTILADVTTGLCHSLDDMNDNHVDGTPVNDTSVESSMISRDDIPLDNTSVESLMSSLGMIPLWITPLFNC